MKKCLWIAWILLLICIFSLSACDGASFDGGEHTQATEVGDTGSELESVVTTDPEEVSVTDPEETSVTDPEEVSATDPEEVSATDPETDSESASETVTAPATATDAPEEITTSAEENAVCAHSFGSWRVESYATCKAEGLRVRRCIYCPETETEIIPINGEHIAVTDAAVEATCKSSGLSEGSHCGRCGTVLVAQSFLPRTDAHTPVTDAALEATCKSTGLSEGSHCEVCGEVLVEQSVLPRTDEHAYGSVEVPATPTAQGYILHVCSVCDASYKDGFFDYAGTETLTYSKNTDGTCLVSGITDASETHINIPSKTSDGYDVVGVKQYAFQYNTAIVAVNAPESVTEIGERAFFNCSSLTSAYLPGVTLIGTKAFDGCSKLGSVIYSDGLKSIGEEAFQYCSALKECRAISSEKNVDTVIAFGYHAFSYSGISNPTFSAELTSTSLANAPFASCKSLGRVDLSAASLQTLGGGFAHSTFTEFLFPKGLEEISRSCFAGCYFGTLTIPRGVTVVESGAFYNAQFTRIVLGESVTRIESSAFEYAYGELDLHLAERLRTVESRAFAGCSAKSIVLPASVTSIGEGAFEECTQLQVLGIPFISTSAESSIYNTNCFGRIFSSNATTANQQKYIPSSLKTVIITSDRVELELADFNGVTLSVLVLPRSFSCADTSLDFNLGAIYYSGDRASFPSISSAVGYKPPKVYYYSEERPASSGEYWHYVGGVPTVW